MHAAAIDVHDLIVRSLTVLEESDSPATVHATVLPASTTSVTRGARICRRCC